MLIRGLDNRHEAFGQRQDPGLEAVVAWGVEDICLGVEIQPSEPS